VFVASLAQEDDAVRSLRVGPPILQAAGMETRWKRPGEIRRKRGSVEPAENGLISTIQRLDETR
jgi:hypothetical protein